MELEFTDLELLIIHSTLKRQLITFDDDEYRALLNKIEQSKRFKLLELVLG